MSDDLLQDECGGLSEWLSENPLGRSQAGNAAAAEIDRLREICRQAHDRLLRGDDDAELLRLLATAWEKST